MFLYLFFSVVFVFGPICSQQHTETDRFNKFRYVDKEGSSLYSAIARNDEELFDVELNFEGDPKRFEFTDSLSKETLCHKAVSYHRGKMLRKLASKVDVDAQAHDGQTVVHYAVFYDDKAALNILCKHNADFELRDIDGVTPFALAVRLDRKAIAEDLLRKNVNIRARNKYGHEPLHFARSATMVRRLLANGADINVQGMFGHTPIVFAVSNNIKDVVEELIDNRALTDYVDEYGNTLLHLARSGEVAQLLIDAGLSVHAENKKGDKPLHCAACLVLQDLRIKN